MNAPAVSAFFTTETTENQARRARSSLLRALRAPSVSAVVDLPPPHTPGATP